MVPVPPPGASYVPPIPEIPYNQPIRQDALGEHLLKAAKMPFDKGVVSSVLNFFRQYPFNIKSSQIRACAQSTSITFNAGDLTKCLEAAEQGSNFFLNAYTAQERAVCNAENTLLRVYFVCMKAICYCLLDKKDEAVGALSLASAATVLTQRITDPQGALVTCITSVDPKSVSSPEPILPIKAWASVVLSRLFLQSDPPDIDAVIFNSNQVLMNYQPNVPLQGEICINMAMACTLIGKIDLADVFYQQALYVCPDHPLLPAISQAFPHPGAPTNPA